MNFSLLIQHWLDWFLLLMIVGALAVGFSRGLLWEFIGLASLYIGIVLAAQYYAYLSDFMRQLSQSASPSKLLDAAMFIFLLMAVSLVVDWLVYDTLRTTKLKLFPSIDHLGGTALGLVAIMVLIILVTPVVSFGLGEPWPTGWPENLRGFLETGMEASTLIPILNEFKPILVASLKPWLPFGSAILSF